MSVPKRKRKQSDLEVFHHFYKMRREITDLLLRDFGYSLTKSQKAISKRFGDYETLSPEVKIQYDKKVERDAAFAEWFILDERNTVMDCLRNINEELHVANDIYPTNPQEYIERRLHQDRAIGQCGRLTQELQYTIETLPVDINKYTRFAEMIDKEVSLIKGWRKSDNRFRKKFEEDGTWNNQSLLGYSL